MLRFIDSTVAAAALIALLLAVIATGCSGGSALPEINTGQGVNADLSSTHRLFGLYEINVDINARTIEAVPLRQAELRVNVLPFLEPPALMYLKIDFSDLQIIPPSGGNDGLIKVDVLITHPFGSQTEFTGFDVKGIVFGPTLDNYDGMTRWWNPVEFTGNGIFGYKPGLLGSPDSSIFTRTINDYKYFCKDLGENQSLDVSPVIHNVIEQRGHFPAGQTLSRHYDINFGPEETDFFKFQYAVDASWAPPSGTPPYSPDDFPPAANQPEAWNVTCAAIENTLNYYGGVGDGDLILYVDVYDWQGFSNTEVTVSCDEAGVFDPVTSTTPKYDCGYFAIYELAVGDATPSHSGMLPLTIAVESTDKKYDYGDPGSNPYPPGNVTAYERFAAEVTNNPPSTPDCDTTLHAEGGWTTNLALDSSGLNPIWDISFIESGTYAGSVIYPWRSASSGNVTALHFYNADLPVSYPTNGTFHTFPASDLCTMIWSIDCDPVMGRVLWVGNNKPDTFRILDDSGTKLGELKVQAATQLLGIQAACFDGDGNLWVLSLRQTMFEPDYELRRYKPSAGSPYYSQDQYLDLSPYNPFSLLSFIYDMDYDNQVDRLYIFDMHGSYNDLGSVEVFDVASDGKPAHNTALSKEDIFPKEVDLLPPGIDGRHSWVYHTAWGGDIVIDHSAGTNEHCRIVCMAVIEDDPGDSDTDTYWVLFDEDLNILDDFNEPYGIAQGGKCWDTFAINPDEHSNIAAMWRSSTWEYSAKPSDW